MRRRRWSARRAHQLSQEDAAAVLERRAHLAAGRAARAAGGRIWRAELQVRLDVIARRQQGQASSACLCRTSPTRTSAAARQAIKLQQNSLDLLHRSHSCSRSQGRLWL